MSFHRDCGQNDLSTTYKSVNTIAKSKGNNLLVDYTHSTSNKQSEKDVVTSTIENVTIGAQSACPNTVANDPNTVQTARMQNTKTGWLYAQCTMWRKLDTWNVKAEETNSGFPVYKYGSFINFKAGFKIWPSSSKNSGQDTIREGHTENYFTYNVIDSGAVALTLGLASAATTSILF